MHGAKHGAYLSEKK